jgi:general stress protein CsbA
MIFSRFFPTSLVVIFWCGYNSIVSLIHVVVLPEAVFTKLPNSFKDRQFVLYIYIDGVDTELYCVVQCAYLL